MRFDALFLSLALSAVTAPTTAPNQQALTDMHEQTALHQSPDWALIAPHLPNPATATAAQLETAGDVLAARRFPEDALEFYTHALTQGGDTERLTKKQGVVRLQMQQGEAAHTLFKRCVQLDKNDAEAWNNLAASDYSIGNLHSAINEYKRAVKLRKSMAVFHANLGMAYFSDHEIDSAKSEFATAVRLDPRVMDQAYTTGTTLHMLQAASYGTMCYELARMYMNAGNMEEAKAWLERAAERGLDLRAALSDDSDMHVWLKNPDIQLLIQNSERMHKHLAEGSVPSLGSGRPSAQN